jgi:hypothetical protein
MKKLILLGLFVSVLSMADIQYNGRVVNGECSFSLTKREKIIDRYILDKVYENDLLGSASDDFEITFWWRNKNTKKKYSEKIKFCRY